MLNSQGDSGRLVWPVFATTHWSVVLQAKDEGAPGAPEAFETLCRAYWQPLYAFVRREGYSDADAKDLTQEFFERLIEKKYLDHLRHQAGRFRSFLLTFLKHYLQEARGRAQAQKRGGGRSIVSLQGITNAGDQYGGAVDHLTPEDVFDRRWAQAVLQRSFDHLRAEYSATGKDAIFKVLADFQPREPGAPTYTEIGALLGMSENAVKSAAHRLRERHREILREEVAKTVSHEGEIDEELRFLRSALGKGAID